MILKKEKEKSQKNLFYWIIDVARYILGTICFGIMIATSQGLFDFRTILYGLAGISLFPITYKIISKKKVIKYIWQILIGIFLFGLAYFSDNLYTNNLNNIIDYYSTAENFADNILESGIKLEDIGNDIKNYWINYIYDEKYDSIDDAVNKALNDNSYNITLLKSNHSTIKSYYSELLKCPNNFENCDEIKQKVQDAYNVYTRMYNLIMYPSGSYNDFINEFRKYDTELLKKYDELTIYLDVYNN